MPIKFVNPGGAALDFIGGVAKAKQAREDVEDTKNLRKRMQELEEKKVADAETRVAAVT
jgi:hypothetical protein